MRKGFASQKYSLERTRRWRFLPVVAMAIVGVAVSLAMFAAMQRWEWHQIQADLTVAANARITSFDVGLDVDEDAVNAIHRFAAVSGKVEEADFHEFAGPFTAGAPGLCALAWVSCDRGNDGVERFPIRYVEPRCAGRLLVQFDLAANADLHKTLAGLRDSGQSATLAGLPLPPELGGWRGLLLVRPAYKKGVSSDTAGRRRENFLGFVVGVFSMTELVDVALAKLPPEGIHIDFYDVTTPGQPRFLFRHVSRLASQFLPFIPDELYRSENLQLQVGKGTWRIVCYPVPAFIAKHQTWQPLAILCVALAMTFLGCVIVHNTVRRACATNANLSPEPRSSNETNAAPKHCWKTSRRPT